MDMTTTFTREQVLEYLSLLDNADAALRAENARLEEDKEWFEECACSCSTYSQYVCAAHRERTETNTSAYREKLHDLTAHVERLNSSITALGGQLDDVTVRNAYLTAQLAALVEENKRLKHAEQ